MRRLLHPSSGGSLLELLASLVLLEVSIAAAGTALVGAAKSLSVARRAFNARSQMVVHCTAMTPPRGDKLTTCSKHNRPYLIISE
jgi:hypothetical protein